jgi:hypothetical protein
MLLDEARRRIAVLERAKGGVELGRVGIAAVMTEQAQAYLDLLEDDAALAAVRSDVETLAASGSAARRVYGALLLRAIDADAGRAAFEAMADSDETFSFAPGGCRIETYTLREYGKACLERQAWFTRTTS